MNTRIVSDQPILSDDQRSLMRLAREAQTGNLVAALSLTPLIARLTAHLEGVGSIPESQVSMPLTLERRFWAKVNKTDSCWLWTGARLPRSTCAYGRLSVQGRSTYAHRFSYEMSFGPIPSDMCVCHTCDNPICVNPAHLFLGTQADNMWDKASKGRASIVRAPKKLTPEQVLSIRAEYVPNVVGRVTLARKYGVSTTTIKQIIRREIWNHI